MANFDSKTKAQGTKITAVIALILTAVFAVEGGYSNDPRDPGGATNHGITEKVARNHGYTGDMRNLTKDQAKAIYYKDYILKPGYVPFLELSPAVAQELIDSAVNAGPGRSSRWLQTSLNALNRNARDYPDIPVDGRVGPATVSAYEGLVRKRGKVKACQMVLKLLEAEQAKHYTSLTKMEVFVPGWVDQRLGNVPLVACEK